MNYRIVQGKFIGDGREALVVFTVSFQVSQSQVEHF